MKDRNAMRERLMQRMQTGGKTQQGLFKANLQGVNFLKLAEGQNMFDIIPYIAGPNDPNCPEGDETYLLEVFVHQNCGIKEGKKMCLLETYGKKCPICEDKIRRQRAGGAEGSAEIIKSLTPSKFPRTIYNVLCYNSREQEARGIQVFEASFYSLEMSLREMAKRALRPGDKIVDPFIPFMDIKDGKTIVFKAQDVGKPSLKFVGIRFEDRDYDLDEKLIEKAHQLDTLIDIPTYEDMLAWYYGEDGETEGAFRTGRVMVRDDDPPMRRPRPNLEEDVNNDPPPARSRKVESDSECPYGYPFGGVDAHKECAKCDVWDDCARVASMRHMGRDRDVAKDEKGKTKMAQEELPVRKVTPPVEDEPPTRRRVPVGDDISPASESPTRRRAMVEELKQEDDDPPVRRRRL